MKELKVMIVVLNWNGAVDTLECLESCLLLDYAHFELVVIDNHSTDNSVEQIGRKFPQIKILKNSDNLGYSGGNNRGIRYALEKKADYVLLLNNDTVVDRTCLSRLVEASVRRPQAGLLAPKVLFYDRRSEVNSLGTSMDWLRLKPFVGKYGSLDQSGAQQPFKEEILMGCALFVPRKTIERIGLLDEKFFLIHEEADWCYRSLRSGFENLVVPEAVIYHKVSRSLKQLGVLTYYYSTRNFLYLAAKHAVILNKIKTGLGLMFISLKNLIKLLLGNSEEKQRAHAFFGAVMDFYHGRMGRTIRRFGTL